MLCTSKKTIYAFRPSPSTLRKVRELLLRIKLLPSIGSKVTWDVHTVRGYEELKLHLTPRRSVTTSPSQKRIGITLKVVDQSSTIMDSLPLKVEYAETWMDKVAIRGRNGVEMKPCR